MTGLDYTQWLSKKGKKNKKAPEGGEQNSNAAKRSRPEPAVEIVEASASTQVIELESSPTTPRLETIEVQPTSPRETTLVQQGGTSVSLEDGELWRAGVSDRLRAVIRPPPLIMGGPSLTPEMRGMLRHLEENALKTASLVQAVEELAMNLDGSKASNASLSAANDALKKSKAELESSLEAASATQKKLEEELVASKRDLAASQQALSTQKVDFEKLLAEKDDEIKKLSEEKNEVAEELKDAKDELKQANDDYEEARLMVINGVNQAWNNAIAQARVLNPNLVTEGMDIGCRVKDGYILPPTPGGDDAQ